MKRKISSKSKATVRRRLADRFSFAQLETGELVCLANLRNLGWDLI